MAEGAADDSAGLDAAVARSDARAVNRRAARADYIGRRKIFPLAVKGRFRRLKWAIMVATLAVYYGRQLRWERGADLPDQAVLIDFPSRRFYFFFIEIWPQEFYFVTGLLILAALTLFLMTALAGRVWCGYMCPQTVWTDLFIVIEEWLEGARAARIRLDKAPYGLAKLARRAVKHALWLVVAAATGGAWVLYFADAPGLLIDLFTLQAAPVAYSAVAVLTGLTYVLGGHMREQVCTFMCPWPRIQGGLLDEESLIVSYRADRGEPRGVGKREGSPRGDCIDCNHCVAACPMGIDIRDGQQLECITCALCIDACDAIMARLRRPLGLIAYDTLTNQARRRQGQPPRLRLIRTRTVLYTVALIVVGAVMLAALGLRDKLEITAQHDRNPLFVRLSDGAIRNGYTVKLLNKHAETRRFRLVVDGLPAAKLAIVGHPGDGAAARLTVPADKLAAFRVYVTAPMAAGAPARATITLRAIDLVDGTEARVAQVFRRPPP